MKHNEAIHACVLAFAGEGMGWHTMVNLVKHDLTQDATEIVFEALKADAEDTYGKGNLGRKWGIQGRGYGTFRASIMTIRNVIKANARKGAEPIKLLIGGVPRPRNDVNDDIPAGVKDATRVAAGKASGAAKKAGKARKAAKGDPSKLGDTLAEAWGQLLEEILKLPNPTAKRVLSRIQVNVSEQLEYLKGTPSENANE